MNLGKLGLYCVFRYLQEDELATAGLVCKLWHTCVKDEAMWEKIEREKAKRAEDSTKPLKSPRRKLTSISSMQRSRSVTFGNVSRDWHRLGGFRTDHTKVTSDEEELMKLWMDVPVPALSDRKQRAMKVSFDAPSRVDIKKIWKSPYLKYLVRRGIPDPLRPATWANMAGVYDAMRFQPDMYQSTLKGMFGLHPPKRFYRVPNFGGPNFDLLCDAHALSPEGNMCAKRILCVLAMENPDLQFCPTLTDLVQLFLRYLTEPEAYVASKLLLTRSVYLTNSHKSKATPYFSGSFKGTLANCRVFDLLVQQYIPQLHASMKKHELSIGILLYHKWFNRLFVDILPMKIVARIFDNYLLEGLKGLFRIGISILKLFSDDLMKAQTSQEFSYILSAFSTENFDDAFFQDAFSIPLKRAMLNNMYSQSFAKLGAVKDPFVHVYYRPRNLQSSSIIAEDEFEMLWSWLPPSVRIQDPYLVYTSSEQGRSLNYMLDKIGKFETTLFLILSDEDRVFGFVATSPWGSHKNQFFGDRNCFVFQMKPVAEKYTWTFTHSNDRMQYIGEDGLSMGAGAPAITLHKDMTVTSHACPTFQSPQFGLLASFDSLVVEVYSIH